MGHGLTAARFEQLAGEDGDRRVVVGVRVEVGLGAAMAGGESSIPGRGHDGERRGQV